MTVFVVCISHDNYYLSVFSTLEKAEAFVKSINCPISSIYELQIDSENKGKR